MANTYTQIYIYAVFAVEGRQYPTSLKTSTSTMVLDRRRRNGICRPYRGNGA